MTDTRFLAGLALVALASAVVALALLGAAVTRSGARRPGLVAFGLPLALVPVVVATVYGAWALVGVFAGVAMAEDSTGSSQRMLEAFTALWRVARAAWAAVGACALVGLATAVWPGGKTDDAPACSARRAVFLLLLPVLAAATTLAVSRPHFQALRVATAVVSSERTPESEARTEAVLHAAGLPARGSGWLGATSSFISRAAMIGSLGGATALLVLVGLALPGLLLAAPVRFGAGFTLAAAAAWALLLLVAVSMAAGLVHPLRLP